MAKKWQSRRLRIRARLLSHEMERAGNSLDEGEKVKASEKDREGQPIRKPGERENRQGKARSSRKANGLIRGSWFSLKQRRRLPPDR